MMKESVYYIKENTAIGRDIYRMRLYGDISGITRPGQFINIALNGYFLRRPISVSDVEPDRIAGEGIGTITILYKIAGNGTRYMSELERRASLSVLTGLGNGFSPEKAGERPLLIGGGIGFAPMLMLARKLKDMGITPIAAAGFNSREDIILKDEFEELGVKLIIATADGSEGIKGFVTDAVKGIGCTYFYACGPTPMLKALRAVMETDGEYSLEKRMGCGFGACMGCSVLTASGAKRVCKDGPVFDGKDIVWEDLT